MKPPEPQSKSGIRHRAFHPLDPLSTAELAAAVEVIRDNANISDRVLFEHVRLLEPEKTTVRKFREGDDIDRQAFAVVLDRDSGKVYEGVISLNNRTLRTWVHIPDVQCCILNEECEEMAQAVRQHPDFIEAIEKRGITDINQVSIDYFAVSNHARPEEQHRRLSRAHCFFVETPGDNPHVRPIEGLAPVIDLNTMTVLRIEDFGIKPVPPDRGAYRAGQSDNLQAPLAVLQITQPDGAGFQVNGHEVIWQNWRFRVGFTPREGLVLHTLSLDDQGQKRPVIYRASLSELVVPYGDTAGDHYMNHSFDLGEGVFGHAVNALTLGCDCLGEIYYFDVDLVDGHGNVQHRRNAICMHEEDYGILWKHTSCSGNTEVRRSRRLVISSFFTIGNYDYGIFWYLYLDGTIEFEAKLTGMLFTRAMDHDEKSDYGTLVAPNLSGMIHEHYFNVRLDMSIDGDENCVVEVDTDRVSSGPANPHGNAHGFRQTLIKSEHESGRDNKFEDARYWKVINRNRQNTLGWHPGYKLMPGPNIKPMHQPDSPFMKRAGFVAHDLWVTAFEPDQLHAPGNYVSQNENGPGLPQWVKSNRSLVDSDIVLWHTVGLVHIPRPEDFPVMPVEYIGFMLKPVGFFDRNPTLNPAPPPIRHS